MNASVDPFSSYSTQGSLAFMEELSGHMLELFPALSKVRVLRQWAGLCDMTPDPCDPPPLFPPSGNVKRYEGPLAPNTPSTCVPQDQQRGPPNATRAPFQRVPHKVKHAGAQRPLQRVPHRVKHAGPKINAAPLERPHGSSKTSKEHVDASNKHVADLDATRQKNHVTHQVNQTLLYKISLKNNNNHRIKS